MRKPILLIVALSALLVACGANPAAQVPTETPAMSPTNNPNRIDPTTPSQPDATPEPSDTPQPTEPAIIQPLPTRPLPPTVVMTMQLPQQNTPAPGGDIGEVPADVIAQIQKILAAQFGIQPEDIQAFEGSAREWPDPSLGCPMPDAMYQQVITPGYQVLFNNAAGEVYDVRTNDRLSIVLLCRDGSPILLDPIDTGREP